MIGILQLAPPHAEKSKMGNKLSYPEADLSGKVVIVTGGNRGVGYETAKGLARLGAHTFIACRSKERAEEAIDRMKVELKAEKKDETESKGKETVLEGEAAEGSGDVVPKEVQLGKEGEGGEEDMDKKGGEESGEGKEDNQKSIKVEYIPLDLSSFQSTIDCVHAFKEKNLPLHILINNAALCAVPYSKTDAGFETQFHVNHLGPMLLTLELLPLIVDTAASSGDGRIIFLSSLMHTQAWNFDVTRLSSEEQEYGRFTVYGNTKLYNVMSGYALQRRLPNKNITVSSVHPGYVETGLSRGIEDLKIGYFLQQVTVKAFGRKPVAGAATSLNCAVNPDLNSQQHFYYDSCCPKQSSVQSRNETFQEQLWSKTFEFLKDYLSPETVENYGPKEEDEASNQGITTSNQEVIEEDVHNKEVATGNQEVAEDGKQEVAEEI